MINWLGFRTLYKKEVNRFLKVYNQTLIAPMVNAMLFFAIFSLALGDRVRVIHGIEFQQYMVPGLIMMTLLQNAFANTSSSFIMGKVLGTLTDLLMPPISAGEMTGAMVLAAITRGIVSASMVALAICMFSPLAVHNIGLLFFYAFFAAALMGILGLLAGVFAESFDQMSAITSYVITPLTFLSGTFYSTKNLPEFWQQVNMFNPFFYMIDGFRYSMLGVHDAPIANGMIAIVIATTALYILTLKLIAAGYRIKN
jgi:ABC-2 type transport system permease protein